MIEVYSISYTAKELRSVPEDERTFFLAMTGLANDVQTLNKQFLMAMDFKDENKIVQQGAHSVAMLNLKMLAGRMYEGWKNIKNHYPKIACQYDNLLTAEAQKAQRLLDEYFSPAKVLGKPKPPPSLLEMMRQKIGFHSDLKFIAKNFDAFSDDSEMGEYICKTRGNTLYFSAELIHLQILSNLCGWPKDPIGALNQLVEESISVTRLINDFAFGLAHAFLALHFNDKLKAMPENLESIEGQPKITDLRIPYFTEILPQNRIKKGARSAPIDTLE